MSNLQQLAEEWRRIAKAQMEQGERCLFKEPGVASNEASRVYTRCADDLEKALAGASQPMNKVNTVYPFRVSVPQPPGPV